MEASQIRLCLLGELFKSGLMGSFRVDAGVALFSPFIKRRVSETSVAREVSLYNCWQYFVGAKKQGKIRATVLMYVSSWQLFFGD